MEVGITGPNGRLGSCLVGMGCRPLNCDITDEDNILETLSAYPVDVLINCAAYTAVDDAEEDVNPAILVNTRGVFYLREVLMNFPETRFIHISTDYVFAGNLGPYGENSHPYKSVNRYGMSKYGGEIMFLNPFRVGDTIVRTTGLYSPNGYDFVDMVLQWLTQETDSLLVTQELFGNQTYVPHLAEALIALAEMDVGDVPTVLNIGSKEVISRYRFAGMIAHKFDIKPRFTPCSNSEIPTWIAKRPTQGGLKVDLAESLGLPIYTIKEGLQQLAYEY